jgi:hypothetical protein
MGYELTTRSGHNMFTMISLLQKAIRRGDKERAGYAAMELFEKFHTVMWNRTMVVANEDCWGILAKEIVALRYTDEVRNRNRKGYEKDTQYVSKAITLLCDAKKSRDACYYACNFVLQTYVTDPGALSKEFVEQTSREIGGVTDDALEIKEISGAVEEWKIPAGDIEARQMSLFDMKESKDTTVTIHESDSKETKCKMWSAYLRKGIRTLDMELTGYAIHNLRRTDLSYVWKTLYVISRNECRGIPTREIVALKHADGYINKSKTLEKREEINICKGVMILMYQISGKYGRMVGNDIMDVEFLVNWKDHEFIDIRNCDLPGNVVPEWVYDVHTIKGKKAGKTDWGMNSVEQEALSPLQVAFFDEGSWQPRYEYKHLHDLCSDSEYQAMLEYSKTHKGNPVEKIQDKY